MSDTATTMADLPGSGLLRRGGGQFRLNSERIKMLVEPLRAGAFVTEAVEFAGISRQSYYEYRDIGIATLERLGEAGFVIERERTKGRNDEVIINMVLVGEGIPPEVTDQQLMCVKMVIEVTHAEREAEVRMLTQWSIAAQDDWRAAAAFMSKRWRDRWGDVSKTEITGAGGGPIEVTETRADLARTIAEDPEARRLASDLLARVVPSAVFGMDMSLEDDDTRTVDEGDEDNLPDITAVEEPEDVPLDEEGEFVEDDAEEDEGAG